jgi:hypothetical protein
MTDPKNCILFSGGAKGTEAEFGRLAEQYGIQEVNFSFDGHRIERTRGLRMLTSEELVRKDVSLSYVSKLLNRKFTDGPYMRKVLQTIQYQVESADQVFVIGTIMEDGTIKGGSGWGAEYAKICNKPLFVFGQLKNGWFRWEEGQWVADEAPVITGPHFTGTGTRLLEENGVKAVEALFARSFK